MATTTTNLGLIEPAGQDRALVANINSNSDKIDAEAGKARANFALVQNGDTATQAISQGQLVVWKGALKKATANISNGATLSSSNLTDDSIATEIASLNSNIANLIQVLTETVTYTDANVAVRSTVSLESLHLTTVPRAVFLIPTTSGLNGKYSDYYIRDVGTATLVFDSWASAAGYQVWKIIVMNELMR